MTPVQETFTEALEFTSEFTPRSFPNLLKHLEPTWVEEALMSTGTATICRRRVPAEQTVWLLLGMALMRDLPITEARQLDIALPARDGTRTVASSALTQAWTDPHALHAVSHEASCASWPASRYSTSRSTSRGEQPIGTLGGSTGPGSLRLRGD